MPKNYIKIGSLLKPVGTNGEIKVEIDDQFVDDLVSSDHFFLRINGSYVPYFIENLRETNFILIKIEEINNPETASTFNLKDIFLEESAVASKEWHKQQSMEDIKGFTLFDEKKRIGIITDIEIFPHQIMAWVLYEGKNMPVPLADSLIEEIDFEKQKIVMKLPEGLLEI
jgi:16S rRNA processing protein RimM